MHIDAQLIRYYSAYKYFHVTPNTQKSSIFQMFMIYLFKNLSSISTGNWLFWYLFSWSFRKSVQIRQLTSVASSEATSSRSRHAEAGLISARFFSERVISEWNALPDWAVNSATVNEFKSSLSKCLSSRLYNVLDWNLGSWTDSSGHFSHTLVTQHGIELLHSSSEIHWSIFPPIYMQTHCSNSHGSTSPLKLPPAGSWGISFLQGFPPLLVHLRDRETKQLS